MTLNFTTLENAADKLADAINKYDKYERDEELQETVRDSLVKRFEFTYEHSAKLLARCLREKGYSEIDSKLKKTLFREGGKLGYLRDVEKWFICIDLRNRTSHEYDERLVEDDEYIEFIKNFLLEVQDLIKNMKEKNGKAKH
jgi:nucleotidyltransferase substrate binding protein (TIGR01987 family)